MGLTKGKQRSIDWITAAFFLCIKSNLKDSYIHLLYFK